MSDEEDPLKRVEELLRKAQKPAQPPAPPEKKEPPKAEPKPAGPAPAPAPKVEVRPAPPPAVPAASSTPPGKTPAPPLPKVEPRPAVAPVAPAPPKMEAKPTVPAMRTEEKGKPAAAAAKPRKPKSGKMREPRVEKVVVNIGVGEAGEKLAKAEKVLQMVTKQKAIRTISKTTNKDLGIRWGMPLGCKVTIRKKAADEFLKTALWVKDNKITSYSFDPSGNFSFGISDFTDFPGQKYNPEIGIFGMDVCVVVARPGRRVSVRDRSPRKIPRGHRLTKAEVMEWLKKKYGVEVVD